MSAVEGKGGHFSLLNVGAAGEIKSGEFGIDSFTGDGTIDPRTAEVASFSILATMSLLTDILEDPLAGLAQCAWQEGKRQITPSTHVNQSAGEPRTMHESEWKHLTFCVLLDLWSPPGWPRLQQQRPGPGPKVRDESRDREW